MKIGKLLTGLEKKYLFYSLLTPVVMIGEVIMETFIPLIMSKIIDEGIARNDLHYVYITGLIMIAATVFSLVCGAAGGRLSSVAAFGFSKNLRFRLFKNVQFFSFSQIDKFTTGSLVTRLTTDVTNVQNTYQNMIRGMIRSPMMLLCGTVMALFINARLASLFLISIPVLAVLLAFITTRAYPRFKIMFKKYDRLNTVVQENLIAIRVVKAFVRSNFENEKFQDIASQVRDAQVKAEKTVIFMAPVMKLTIYVCIIATLWFGGNMVLRGSMKTGELVSFLTYVTQILMSLMMLSMMFVQFVLTGASVNRIMEILEEKCEESPADQSTLSVDAPENGEVQFKNIFFSYSNDPNNCVLTDINLTIPSGATVGIIGGTGASKTTLVSLIPRLYKPLSGSILLAGRNVSEYSYHQVRQAVSMVLQNNVLFSGTIGENLRWGDPAATDSQLEDACRKSDALDFVKSFPEGFNTMLGQNGVNLSGGQKQRLCIARALLKKPKLLILDDSTSAVDTSTDLRIRKALKDFLPETTKIIIAQRIASVKDADFIVVMDDGKINGTGTHERLLEENKIYREVYESQMSKN